MRRLRNRLNTAQRVVVVVAAGWIAQVVGKFATDGYGMRGGWFGFAPNTSAVYSPEGSVLSRSPGLQVAMWVALVGAWAAFSLWVLARRGD